MNFRIFNTFVFATAVAAAAFAQAPDFIQPASYATGGSSKYVAVADFNHDGRPDIATYESATQSPSLMFGNAAGSFQAPVSRGLGFSASSIAAADFDRDGNADLVLAAGGGVAVLFSVGDGSFAPPAFYSAGISANYVAVADLAHDGVLDLVVAGANGFAILRGLGPGTFAAPVILPGALNHFWVGVADFDGDGNLDLVGDGSPGQFYAGHGDGTFASPVTSNTIPYGAVVGDFNADGKMDVAYLVTTSTRSEWPDNRFRSSSGPVPASSSTPLTSSSPGPAPARWRPATSMAMAARIWPSGLLRRPGSTL